MKQTTPTKILLFLFLVSCLSFLLHLVANAAAVVPQASEEGLNNTPIPDCHLVHIDNEGTATTQLYIGDQNGNQRRAIDNSAIRGSKLQTLTQDDFSVVASDHFTFSASAGTWTWQTTQGSGITATISISFKVPYRLIKKEIIYEDNDLDIDIIMPPAGFVIREEDTPTSITLYCSLPAARGHRGRLTFKGFSFVAVPYGEEAEVVNDLTTNSVLINDNLGEYNLASLRQILLHHYDGNRGEDWARYPAAKDIHADAKTIALDHAARYRIRQAADATHIMAANHDAISIYADGGRASDTYQPLKIVDWAPSTNGVDIAFEQDITGYNSNNLRVLYSNNPTNTFTALTRTTDWTLTSPNLIHVKPSALSTNDVVRLFKIGYEGTISNTARVVVSTPLILKGDDNQYYQIHINGGVISATPVSL